MKVSTLAIGVLVGAIVGLAVGFACGRCQGQFQVAFQENRVACSNLRFRPTALGPQLREYLKARVYSNVAAFYPSKSGYLLSTDWDHGSVDRGVLGSVMVCKDPDWAAWDWSSAVRGK